MRMPTDQSGAMQTDKRGLARETRALMAPSLPIDRFWRRAPASRNRAMTSVRRFNRIVPAMTQILARRPTRAALIFEMALQLTPFPDVERYLEELDCDELHFDTTRPSPHGSLGQACKNFWLNNALPPLAMRAPAAPTSAEKLLFRRMLLHDVCHVLLDFKPDWPGQLGVSCFVAAQRYCPQFEWSARQLAQVYTTAAPWLRDELAEAEARGRRLAVVTPRLLTMRIEREWETPVAHLRDRLGIRKMRTLRPIEWNA
jgi:ubiquinone biosynthesis protein Coq4